MVSCFQIQPTGLIGSVVGRPEIRWSHIGERTESHRGNLRRFVHRVRSQRAAQKIGPAKLDSDNYPESLQQLVDGIKATGSVDKKMKYLRRIPKDPMTNSFEWGLRSDRDDPTSLSWGGQNVFDVYTKSMDKARDGSSYAEW